MMRRRTVIAGLPTLAASVYRASSAIGAAQAERSAQHREALRSFRFVWVPFEAGAPSVDPHGPFGSGDAMADLARLEARAAPDALRRLYATTMHALPEFFAAAAPHLAPGRYKLDGADVAHLREIAATMAKLRAPFDPGLAADGSFAYTAEHAAILPRLRWGASWTDGDTPLRPDQVVSARDADTGETTWPVLTVDPKRPYGDMTYVEADMAEALNIPVGQDAQGYASLPADVEARLGKLHQSTVAALRVLVQYGAQT